MARYIDADALIEMLNNKAKTDHEMGLYNHGALTQSFIRFVERQPTADVVPKSEVSRLQEDVDRLQEINNRQVENIKLAKAEVAREIFEEIADQLRGLFDFFRQDDCIRESCAIMLAISKIAELKKKYQEGE